MKESKKEEAPKVLTLEEANEEVARLRKTNLEHAAQFQVFAAEASDLKAKIAALYEERNALKMRLEKVDKTRPPEQLTLEVKGLRKEIGAKDSLISNLNEEIVKLKADLDAKGKAVYAALQRASNLEATASEIQAARNSAQSERNAALAKLGMEEQAKRDAQDALKAAEAKLKEITKQVAQSA